MFGGNIHGMWYKNNHGYRNSQGKSRARFPSTRDKSGTLTQGDALTSLIRGFIARLTLMKGEIIM